MADKNSQPLAKIHPIKKAVKRSNQSALPAGAAPSGIPAITEQKQDSFTKYQNDPRLITDHHKDLKSKQPSPLLSDLQKRVRSIKDEEQFLDEIRFFKTEQQQRIIDSLEQNPLKNRKFILNTLSEIACSIIEVSYEHIKKKMEKDFGLPTFLSSYKQTQSSHLAIVGMGKLGDKTINYFSDLDLIFVYSNIGETQGRTSISNNEFFAKLAQRFISMLSVMTQRGRCYEIDTELRPSGNMGTLVISYDHFIDHQMNKSQNWERQALIRATSIAGETEFRQILDQQIFHLAFNRPLPNNFIEDMSLIRERVIKEKVKESENNFDFKRGYGSLMDIEFILHYTQLKHARVFAGLKLRSVFDVLDELKKYSLFSKQELFTLTEAHLYYRTIESLAQIIKQRTITEIDFTSDTFSEIAKKLNQNPEELKTKILHFKNEVREIYNRIFKR